MTSPPAHNQSESSASQQSPIFAQSTDEWEDDDDMDSEDDHGTEYATGDEIYFAGSDDIEETEYFGKEDPTTQECGKG
jgi:WD repeat-containing protein 23